MRVIIGIVALIAGGVMVLLGVTPKGLADRDVLLIAFGAGLVLLGIRMLVKGAMRMVLLIAACIFIIAGPVTNMIRS